MLEIRDIRSLGGRTFNLDNIKVISLGLKISLEKGDPKVLALVQKLMAAIKTEHIPEMSSFDVKVDLSDDKTVAYTVFDKILGKTTSGTLDMDDPEVRELVQGVAMMMQSFANQIVKSSEPATAKGRIEPEKEKTTPKPGAPGAISQMAAEKSNIEAKIASKMQASPQETARRERQKAAKHEEIHREMKKEHAKKEALLERQIRENNVKDLEK